MGTFAWHVFALPFTTCFHTHVFFRRRKEKRKRNRVTRGLHMQGELLFRVAICEYSRSRLQVAAVFVKASVQQHPLRRPPFRSRWLIVKGRVARVVCFTG